MGGRSNDGRVPRVHYMDFRTWVLVAVVLGFLLVGPIWSEFGPGGPRNRWIEAVVFLVGVGASVALWRFLAKSFPADEVEDLIPRLRELPELEGRRARRRGR
jgi:hypothetical protein